MRLRSIMRLIVLAAAGYIVGRIFGMGKRSADYSKSTWRELQAMRKLSA
ncbi:MAG: hypothetical protein K6T91_06120 [Firmicutes bacterium]|nr:hypothetical protein [Bacillota bacterium]